MKAIIATVLLSITIHANSSFAQVDTSFSRVQDTLRKYSKTIWKQKTDSDRLAVSDTFFLMFKQILQTPGSVSFPFDSVEGVASIASTDGKLRIYTWNVPLVDGTSKYFGFIQSSKLDSVVPLRSVSSKTDDFSTAVFMPENWYGALYYKLIEQKVDKKTLYTLLGWDSYSAETNRKVIDIITLDDGKITFGKPVFKTEAGIKNRVAIEYAKRANMVLRYDYQSVNIVRKNKVKKLDCWLIVMDRLVPMDPTMKGIREYYVPSGDTYDGYIFKDGFWVLVEDVDVVNKKP